MWRPRKRILRLYERSPNVRILIKGPHSVQYFSNIEPHDYVKKYQQQILFEEFSEFRDKIIYLDESMPSPHGGTNVKLLLHYYFLVSRQDEILLILY
jgi:hypothetical protein